MFPNSTIFHSSFRIFVSTCLRNKSFSTRIVIIYTPFLVDIARKREKRCLSACCFEVISDFIDCAKNDPSVKEALADNPEWKEFMNNEYKKYNSLLKSNYGGLNPTKFFQSIKNIFFY